MTGNHPESIFKYIVSRWRIVTFFLLVIFMPVAGWAQKEDDAADDEIPVLIEVKGIGNTEMPAIIRDKDVYLPVNVVFDFLKIKNILSASSDSLTGFYVYQKDVFVIDKVHNRIIFKDSVTNLKPGDILKEETNLYLNLKYFKPIFGLEGIFNLRRLAVTFTSDIELPAIREEKQEMMRKNVSRLKGDLKVDTAIGRGHPAFNFSTADWAVMSTQQNIGYTETRLNLGLGAVVAGGEADASINYYTGVPLDEKQQYFQWRYVNNDNPLLRQFTAGTIYCQSIATLYAPVVGIQLTNASTAYRRSYGTYTLSNTTDPNWIVELYVNGVLVDYKKTDASGFYTFEVPLIYGYSIIKLRFYGPYGEERTTQTYINIPFNFIPVHEFEYTASAGFVEDGKNSIFSRVGVNYGISDRITVGGGAEYLSSVTSGSTMPFVNTSIKLASRLLLSGEYAYGVRKRAVLSYRLPTNLQIDLDYTNYDPGQTAIFYNYREERKAMFTMPVHSNLLSLFSRFTLDQIVVPNAKYTNAELTFTGTVRKVGLNFSNYASFVHVTTPYLYGLFSLSFPLPKKIIFTSQLQYDYKANKAVFMKYTFEKRLFGNGFFNASYQEFFGHTDIENFNGNYRNFLVGMRYDFSFAKVAVSALADNNKGYSRVESASGSFLYDHKTRYLNANNRTNVGKGEIEIVPFLDINCNGIHDPDEPRVQGLKLQINGGRVEYDDKDTIIRIFDLEPYVKYYIDLNKNSFDNIAWQIKNHLISVVAIPNDFTMVEVPVAVVGEVSGVVSVNDYSNGGQKGERQMLVNIYDNSSNLVTHTMTESDGFFSYIGLAPGNYNLRIDTVQLKRLHLRSKPLFLPIHVSQNKEGDIADGLEFTLLPVPDDTTSGKKPANGIGKPGKDEHIVVDTVNATKGKVVLPPDGAKEEISKSKGSELDRSTVVRNKKGGIIVGQLPDTVSKNALVNKVRRRLGSLNASKLYEADGVTLIDIAEAISRFYSGTVVCVLNESGELIDIAPVNFKGEFLLFGYSSYRVTLPGANSGIATQAIFLNEKLHIIETVNKRVVDGKAVYISNRKERPENKVSVKVIKN